MNLFRTRPLTEYLLRFERIIVAHHRKPSAPVATALCSLVLAGCGAIGANPAPQIAGAAPPVQSLAELLPTTSNAQVSQQNPPPLLENAQLVPNEFLACSGSLAEFKATFLKLLNDARAEARQCGNTSHEPAPAVSWNNNLHTAAQRHSTDMSENDFFSHIGSDNSNVAERVDASGYPWQSVGENIAAGQRSAKEAMDGWLTSPGHCRNIMSPAFKEVGVTCVVNSTTEYETYWTNVFGSEFE